MTDASREIQSGERFAFGKNWSRFLATLDEEKIEQAVASLREMLEIDDLTGRSFLDAGSGSGLFSLAARRLGARVHSFDYDHQSVNCTRELKKRYFPDDPDWSIEHGSLLDASFLSRLDHWDIVYSWGVLHHTGALLQAMENVATLVKPDGLLFISIYNDQGRRSRIWARIKQTYNRQPWTRPFLLVLGFCLFRVTAFIVDLISGRSLTVRRNERQERGMSPWHDLVDWMGGWPYETATPDAVFDFYRERNFTLRKLKTRQGIGCNEFVFQKRKD